MARVCGPILVCELLVLVRQYFQYAPLGLLDLLMGALLVFLLTVLLCWLWARWERVDMVQAAQVTGFVSELRQCSRSYWKPEAVRIDKA